MTKELEEFLQGLTGEEQLTLRNHLVEAYNKTMKEYWESPEGKIHSQQILEDYFTNSKLSPSMNLVNSRLFDPKLDNDETAF